MKRLLEPELMEDEAQVKAYAEADFEIPHNEFIQRLRLFIGASDFNGTALDLGCGPGDISCRFAKAFPLCKVHAIDGSKTMLNHAKSVMTPDLAERISFIEGVLPDVSLPQSNYEIIFSNSLLHHLRDPQILWRSLKNIPNRAHVSSLWIYCVLMILKMHNLWLITMPPTNQKYFNETFIILYWQLLACLKFLRN